MHELLRLKKYYKRYWLHTVIGVISLAVIDLLQLFIPRIFKIAIDALASGVATAAKLGSYFLWIMLLALGIAIGRFFWRYLLIGSSRKIERRLRSDFYNHLTTLDLLYFDVSKTGDLMAHATNDINAVRMAIGFGLVILTDILIMGIASIVMMLNISPMLTFYALIPFPLIAFFSTVFGRIIHRQFEMVQASFSKLTERVRENLSGIRVVKVFVQERAEIQRYQSLSDDYVFRNMKLIQTWGLFFPVIMSLAAVGMVIVVGFGGRYVLINKISLGSFVAFIAYLQMLVWPMIAIGRAINLFQRGAASQGRINRILDEKPSIVSGSAKPKETEGGLVIRDLTFTHQGKTKPTLDNIDLTINPRDFIGITGPIGAGKSSLVNLMLRLYEPQSGSIQIDGMNINALAIKDLRSLIAYVPQDTFLFSDTLKENIAFGNNKATIDDIEKVSRIAEIHDEIKQFPEGFETRIGERGITLSGGQKQRVALARALLLNRPILILDDAFSAVDAETERRILVSIKNELSSRTSIIISHRLFAIKEATRIIVIDKGMIIEQGSHKELLRQKGLYYDIFRTQQIEMKLEAF